MFLINSYSYLVLGSVLMLSTTILTWRLFSPGWAIAISSTMMVFLVLVQSIASINDNSIDTLEGFDNILASGSPVLLELYSNFWVACLRAKSDVDRLESDLKNFRVIRINVSSSLGKYIRQKHHTSIVPTFIVFDKNGYEIWRHSGGAPKVETILSLDLQNLKWFQCCFWVI